jgi:hypothetical protein
MVLNWRSKTSNLPSAATEQAKKSGLKKTACLREPMFAIVLLTVLFLAVAAEGFFCETVSYDLSGDHGSGSCLAFLVRENKDADLTRIEPI